MERVGKKCLGSCKISCNVNLKHTCMKTGAGVCVDKCPEGSVGLFHSSTFGKCACAGLPVSSSAVTSFKDILTSDHFCFVSV